MTDPAEPITMAMTFTNPNDVYELYHLMNERYVDLLNRQKRAPTAADRESYEQRITRWYALVTAVGNVYHNMEVNDGTME